MLAEFTASLSAIKASFDLLQVINDADESPVVQKATNELHRQLVALQSENLRLAQLLMSQLDEINYLRELLRKHEDPLK
ncbi:hypothetical protein ACN0IV_11765 [Trabulsiella odontotermitis]|jgi:hypothetical protein|uniref:hypothetical protein n=1 Tax=Trabulsiella odontotermitis TaxID=379893 RepID=UPI003AD183FC